MEEQQGQFITLEELGAFLETHGNMYDNPNGVDVNLTGTFIAGIKIWDKAPVDFTLYAEFEEDDPMLTQKLNLKATADVDRISEAELWTHYRNGDGYVWANLELAVELMFSVVDGATVIEGFQSRYRDEVAEVWDSVTPFRDYVRNNIGKLYIAVEEKMME
jgi:hypothetical protein